MPMRFSTEAANADVMGDDPQPGGVPPEGMPRGPATPTARGDKGAGAQPKRGAARNSKDAGKPGKDINAAGFVKDKDASKP